MNIITLKKGILITILTVTGLSSIKAQYHMVKGKVMAGETPVEFAYIINKRTQTATETREEGRFNMETNLGDTLQFRCLGFKDTLFVVDETMVSAMIPVLKVVQQSYVLNEVEVRWFYSYASFKTAFANVKLSDKNKPFNYNIQPDMNEVLSNAKATSGNAGLSFTMGGKYLTKEQKTANEIKANESRMERYNHLTSYENVQAFTGLKGEMLESFIMYLRTKSKINPEWDDYNIMMGVKAAYANFLASNTNAKPDTIQ